MSSRYAFVTVLTGDSPAFISTLVLGHTLSQIKSVNDRVLVFSPDVPEKQLEPLSRYYNKQLLYAPEGSDYPEGNSATVAALSRYEKLLILANDTLVLRPEIDHLFRYSAPAALVEEDKFYDISFSKLSSPSMKRDFEDGEITVDDGVILFAPERKEGAILETIISRYMTATPVKRSAELSTLLAGRWHSLSYLYNYRPEMIERHQSLQIRSLLERTDVEDVYVARYGSSSNPYLFFKTPEALEGRDLSEGEQYLIDQLNGRFALTGPSRCESHFAHFYLRWAREYQRVENQMKERGVDLSTLYNSDVRGWLASSATTSRVEEPLYEVAPTSSVAVANGRRKRLML